jgi:hypothetical protein
MDYTISMDRPVGDAPAVAPVGAIFRQIAIAVRGGMPCPRCLNVYGGRGDISMGFVLPSEVDEWADYFALPRPEYGGAYRTWIRDCAALPGWAVYIWCPLSEEATP